MNLVGIYKKQLKCLSWKAFYSRWPPVSRALNLDLLNYPSCQKSHEQMPRILDMAKAFCCFFSSVKIILHIAARAELYNCSYLVLPILSLTFGVQLLPVAGLGWKWSPGTGFHMISDPVLIICQPQRAFQVQNCCECLSTFLSFEHPFHEQIKGAEQWWDMIIQCPERRCQIAQGMEFS